MSEVSRSMKPAIVAVEYGFSQPSAFSSIIEKSKKCRQFVSIPEESENSWHGDKVLSILQSTKVDFDFIPIQWSIEVNENNSFEIFDCIDELSKSFHIVGVNFSTGFLNKFRDDLTSDQLKKYDLTIQKLNLKINSFLRLHPEITIALAAGNDSFRIEDVIVFPQSAACAKSNLSNLICITAYNTELKVNHNNQSETKPYAYIGKSYYYFDEPPDGTNKNPFPILGRFTDAGNFIVLPAKEINTSFLSPWYLIQHLTNPPMIFDGYGVSTDLKTKKTKTFKIRYIKEEPLF